MNKIFKLFVACLLLAAVVSCSATPTRRAFKENWRDSMITSKVKWKMGSDKLVKAHNFNVDTWRGIVTLNGRTTNAEEKAKAEEIAKNVKNVKGVRNYIDIVGAESVPQKIVKENVPFQKPTGKFAKTKDITLPTVTPPPMTEQKVTEQKVVEQPTTESAVSVKDLEEEIAPSVKDKNAVSHEISKDLAVTTDDVTLQAEQELKELKAKKKK